MASVKIHMFDKPSGGVEIQFDLEPPPQKGKEITPAQALAAEVFNLLSMLGGEAEGK